MAPANYRRSMVFGLAELLLLLTLIAVGGWFAWREFGPAAAVQGVQRRLPARDRAWLAEAIASARWGPGHDEVDGQTRIVIRRAYTGLDGRPVVLEERVLEAFSARDPAWEPRFTEAMAAARFRCSYLNTEEAGS